MGNCVGGGKGWEMEVIISFSNPTLVVKRFTSEELDHCII